jgi:hypothetical protein
VHQRTRLPVHCTKIAQHKTEGTDPFLFKSQCPPGFFGKFPGVATKQESCFGCPAGRWNPTSGLAAVRVAVVNGAVSGNDTGTGNESEENENDAQYVGCAACAPGTFVEVTNAMECTPCPAGKFLQGEGSKNSADCLPCGKGSFSPVAGLVRAGAFPNPGTV